MKGKKKTKKKKMYWGQTQTRRDLDYNLRDLDFDLRDLDFDLRDLVFVSRVLDFDLDPASPDPRTHCTLHGEPLVRVPTPPWERVGQRTPASPDPQAHCWSAMCWPGSAMCWPGSALTFRHLCRSFPEARVRLCMCVCVGAVEISQNIGKISLNNRQCLSPVHVFFFFFVLTIVLRDLEFDLGSKGHLAIRVVDVPWRWWEGENLKGVCPCVCEAAGGHMFPGDGGEGAGLE